jgi:hypothetical protein
MNSDDKIRMAREAGILPNANLLDVLKFANLVAAAEREACAEACESDDWNVAAAIVRARRNK